MPGGPALPAWISNSKAPLTSIFAGRSFHLTQLEFASSTESQFRSALTGAHLLVNCILLVGKRGLMKSLETGRYFLYFSAKRLSAASL